MSKITNSFYDAIRFLDKGQEIYYYLESKIKDPNVILEIAEVGDILHNIMYRKNTASILRYFEKNRILNNWLHFLYRLRRVEQKKHKSSNAFDHTMRVIEEVPHDDKDMKWAALLHDVGKFDSHILDDDFHKHALYSRVIADQVCNTYRVQNQQKIRYMVEYHMLPLSYQQNPNWSDDAVVRFKKKCGVFTNDVIDLAYYDKKAETDNEEFLEPIIELKERVKNV